MNGSAFLYRNGALCAETVPLAELAEDVETPFYCLSAAQLIENTARLRNAFVPLVPAVFYDVRAQANRAVLHSFVQGKVGLKVSSAGEIERAIEAGAYGAGLMLAASGKDCDAWAAALLASAGRFQISSLDELDVLAQVAGTLGRQAPVVLRLGIGGGASLASGFAQSLGEARFGFALERVPEALARIAAAQGSLSFAGFSLHLETQDALVTRRAVALLADVVRLCRAAGFAVEKIDLSGSAWPTCSQDNQACLASLGCSLSVSAGRLLVAEAGVLVTRLLRVKDEKGRRLCVTDADMGSLTGPALTGAPREVLPLREGSGPLARYALTGPVSDEADQFGDCCLLPPLQRGDLIAILHAGACGGGAAFSGRALPALVFVSGAQSAIVRRRVAVIEQMDWESLPDWVESEDAA